MNVFFPLRKTPLIDKLLQNAVEVNTKFKDPSRKLCPKEKNADHNGKAIESMLQHYNCCKLVGNRN